MNSHRFACIAHRFAVTTVAADAVTATATSTGVIALMHPLAVQGGNEITREQGSRSPAGHAWYRATDEPVAAAWVRAIRWIAAPLAIINIAAPTAATNQISLGLTQRIERTIGQNRTDGVAPTIAVAATVARQATAGSVAHGNGTARS